MAASSSSQSSVNNQEETMEGATSIADHRAQKDDGATNGNGNEPAEPQGAPVSDPDLTIDGLESGVLASFGGKKPTSASMRLMGSKVVIEGSFEKGAILDLHVKAVVTSVTGQDSLDDDLNVKATERQHKARIIAVSRA